MQFALGAKQLFGATIEEGEVPVAIEAGDSVSSGLEDLTELADGGVAQELRAFAVRDVAGEDDDAIFVGMDKHLEPYIERLRVVGLELGGDAALHRREVVGPERLLIVEGEALPEVFTDEIVSLEDGEGSTVGKGAVPVAVDADDRIGRGVEDLAELADGVVAKVFGAVCGR